LIKDLIDKNYLESEIIYKKNTKEIEHRYLKINKGGYLRKIKGGYLKNLKGGIKENLKDNNTSINNNNIYIYYENIFARTLNAIEYETMTKWLESKTEDEIKNAINETAKSNIDNIKYVEKVLFSKKRKVEPSWFNKEIEESEITPDDDFKNFIEEFRK
jgi:DnaD/phage-associated family protein